MSHVLSCGIKTCGAATFITAVLFDEIGKDTLPRSQLPNCHTSLMNRKIACPLCTQLKMWRATCSKSGDPIIIRQLSAQLSRRLWTDAKLSPALEKKGILGH